MISYFLAVEEALKTFLEVSLTLEQARSLTVNLRLSGTVSARIGNNLGKIVLAWMGASVGWEVRELVETLVCTKGLGRYTNTLCTNQGTWDMCGRLGVGVCGSFSIHEC